MQNKCICVYPIIAVRAMPDERAEMVTQILFGEFFELQETNHRWALVKLINDNYRGWIDLKLVNSLSEVEYKSLMNGVKDTAVQPFMNILVNNFNMLVPGGASLFRNPETLTCTIGSRTISLPVMEMKPDLSGINAVKLALNYLNAPYLWGGKTVLGIDCSGLIQIVYGMMGLQIPRDASQQAGIGEPVLFAEEAKPGDLAFFDNPEGKITHVGLVMENKKIIHASGSVRIDSLDHQGIYNHEIAGYTHRLRLLKRLV